MQKQRWKNLTGQLILGGEHFGTEIQELVEEKKEKKEIPKAQRYLGRPALEQLFFSRTSTDKKERNRVICKAYYSFEYTLKEIADYEGVHYTTVSRVISKGKKINYVIFQDLTPF